MAALAPSTVTRCGMAAKVVRIMPVLYSPLMTRTARTATTAWPNWIPVRLSLAVLTGQATPDGHRTAALAAALTATVAATVAISNQAGPVTVRSLVHSACSCVPQARQAGVPREGEAQLAGRPGLAHASLRRISTAARPRASAVHAHSTAKPAHGASGKYPVPGE